MGFSRLRREKPARALLVKVIITLTSRARVIAGTRAGFLKVIPDPSFGPTVDFGVSHDPDLRYPELEMAPFATSAMRES